MDNDSLGLGTYVVGFLLLLTPLVFVHEMGHFLIARLFKVRVEIFSIGFGREIFGWFDKHGTRWKVSWIPLGGYVKFFGDAGAASNPDSEELETMTEAEKAVSFHHKPLIQRAAVILAGPLVNFIFAALVFAGFFTAYGQPYSTPEVAGIAENSGAAAAGMEPGDIILSVDGRDVTVFEDVVAVMQLNQGEPLDVVVERGGERIGLIVQPTNQPTEDRFGNRFDRWRIGITGATEIKERGPLEALYFGSVRTIEMTGMMLKGLGQMILGLRSVEDLGGPLRIAEFSGQMVSQGWAAFISFMALISINLGLVNLFPIPMLDGGHLLFYGMEAVRGKPVSLRVQEAGYLVGLSLVLALMVFVTWNDLRTFKIIETISELF